MLVSLSQPACQPLVVEQARVNAAHVACFRIYDDRHREWAYLDAACHLFSAPRQPARIHQARPSISVSLK